MAYINSGKAFDKEKNHDSLTKSMTEKDVKPYLLNIPSDLLKKVKRKLVEDEKSMRDILIEYLYKYINE
jgi:hypothetical protein